MLLVDLHISRILYTSTKEEDWWSRYMLARRNPFATKGRRTLQAIAILFYFEKSTGTYKVALPLTNCTRLYLSGLAEVLLKEGQDFVKSGLDSLRLIVKLVVRHTGELNEALLLRSGAGVNFVSIAEGTKATRNAANNNH